MPNRTALRTLRVTMFSAVCVVLGAYGHWLDSGHHPTAAPLLFGTGLVVFMASRLAGRERSLAGLAAATVAIQAGLHVAFVFGDAAHVSGAGHDLSAGAAAAAPGALPVGPVAGLPATEPRLGMTAGMALAHLVAALVAAWWLRAGEAALWSLCRRAAGRAGAPLRLLLAVLAGGPPPHPPVHVRGWPAAPPGRTRLLRHALCRRGPPCPAVS
jgi:hypothetical protein